MSLYEMFSTFSKLTKDSEKPLTQERVAELKSAWKSLGLKDVRV